MSTLYLYRDDYIENPRDAEGSNKVVRLWYDERVRYADEEITDDQCMGLVAERLIVRRLLGIEKLDMAYMSKASQAKPFGLDAPMLAELMTPGTFIAMALFPLSPQGMKGMPIMARLYCVSGLSNRFVVPLVGVDEGVLKDFSWFLAGVPRDKLQNGVVGRSWLLAANLLARIVGQRDVKTARNLAKHYIVTGDVSGGVIHRVEMLRKPELAKQFDNFKWIIPKENDMDIPKRKIEKPATLEEAYKLIETMQNTMTRDLCAIVNREIDTKEDEWNQRVERIKDLLFKGADPNAVVHGKCAWQMFRDKHDALLDSKLDSKQSDVWSLEQVSLIDRVFSFYGAVPQFFFMLAHAGETELLEALARIFDIDAIDYTGETALDFAEEANDKRAQELLVTCGAKKRGRFLVTSDRFLVALVSLETDQYLGRQEAERILLEALDNGLSASDKFSCGGRDGWAKSGGFRNNIPLPEEPMDDYEYYEWEKRNYVSYAFENTRYESTVLLEALYVGNRPIVEKCLVAGVDPNVEIRAKYGSVLQEKLIDGKTVEKHDEELEVSDDLRKSNPIDEFIRFANARNEFPDKDLAMKVIKYFDELKSNGKAQRTK